jgi:hypothetical protein
MDETGELTAHMVRRRSSPQCRIRLTKRMQNNVLLPQETFVVSNSMVENIQTLNDVTDKLLARDCFLAIYLHDNKWWVRGSAQVWNDVCTISSHFRPIGELKGPLHIALRL